MKNSNKMQIILLGAILLVELSLSEAVDKKSEKPVHRSLEKNRRAEVSEKDEKLRTASQNLFGYNNGFNPGFNSNGFSTGVNNGVYPQGSYASSGSYTGGNFNQNGVAGYPIGYNGNNANGFGFQGQGLYPGGSFPSQGFQQGGFNTLGGAGGRYPFNNFGMPFNTQGAIGIGNYQSAGYPSGLYQGGQPNGLYQGGQIGQSSGLYQGGQITDRRANQYIGNGITVGNKIDVGGDGRSSGVSSSRTGRTNQPGFVAGQFGLNYADQQAYNILPGGVFNANNNGFGYPGGAYRQNPNVYNQQLDYNNRFPNSGSGANRYYQGVNPQGSFQQRIHRFVGPDADRN